ncbi:N-acetylglucosamine-6-sulfatase [Patella vulgata]|uniref:N-acetylglucosamine-6-sulfatase n=1 Tax=Patella vulgata TaxID=6465 RepID=UPI0024A89A26|nr:N-acetylglucosamine-6-sulfatase [Patella vulgata]
MRDGCIGQPRCWYILGVILITSYIPTTTAKPPNIVFILTDDQDYTLGSQNAIKKITNLIGSQGIIFNNMFVSSPLCCPSRSSIFSGKYVHNHMAANNSVDGNCSSYAWQQAEEPHAFPVYLKNQGYRTFFSGKYLNLYGFPQVGGPQHVPPGWDWWVGLVGNSRYYNYDLSVNGTRESHGNDYKNDYLTDVIHRRGMEFLNQQSADGDPFFMMLSTPACHEPFTPAPQYADNFTGMVAPRDGSYNKHGDEGKHWLIRQAITPMPNDTVILVDDIFRNRWRTLLSVDDMVEDVYNTVKAKNMIDNTYFIFSSDNGFHLGQFSMPYDKRQLYEFDVRVPLMISGPGIKPGQVSSAPVMNIDLGPTFVELSGQSVPAQMDGVSMVPILMSDSSTDVVTRENFLVEHYGEHLVDNPGCPQLHNQGMMVCHSHCECQDSWNNTYSCLRVIGQGKNYKYCQLEDLVNFVEVYDLDKDPYEFDNIVNTADQQLIATLKQELFDLSRCSGIACKSPPLNI